ncbi:MAG: hypothetical protein ACE366_18555 [Bradymonadia bacterium]
MKHLAANEADELEPALEAFGRARHEYLYMIAWSSDVSIPMHAIEAEYNNATRHWQTIQAWVKAHGLAAGPAEVLVDGEKREPLYSFFAKGCHLAAKWEERAAWIK